ncbi:hypothetical protein NDU88_004078 [Pleurodeles waltl]|uniref:Uncharacterized protein n=1 Tax=Pleurodeles waltl TaxID=8319 RepID=A0AAV7WU24_PLEWA|nr:hypothetical protein NDU88_004078 [Pleurodeles waltl]
MSPDANFQEALRLLREVGRLDIVREEAPRLVRRAASGERGGSGRLGLFSPVPRVVQGTGGVRFIGVHIYQCGFPFSHVSQRPRMVEVTGFGESVFGVRWMLIAAALEL